MFVIGGLRQVESPGGATHSLLLYGCGDYVQGKSAQGDYVLAY